LEEWLRLQECKKSEAYLIGKRWTIENIKSASEILYNEFDPIGDARAEAETRRIAVKIFY